MGIIVIGTLTQLVDRIAPDLERKFVTDKRVISLVLRRSDKYLEWGA